MSLKSFHIFTLLVAIAGCCAYSMWSVAAYLREGDVIGLFTGICLMVVGVALVMHGVIFFKHTEEEPWL